MSYRLLKSSFFLVQSMGGALLLERFWCASSLTCCRDMLSAGIVSVIKPWEKKKYIRDDKRNALYDCKTDIHGMFPGTNLGRCVCRRSSQWGVGWSTGWRRTDWQLWVPLSFCGPPTVHLGTQPFTIQHNRQCGVPGPTTGGQYGITFKLFCVLSDAFFWSF